jgi:hypothetical protein
MSMFPVCGKGADWCLVDAQEKAGWKNGRERKMNPDKNL